MQKKLAYLFPAFALKYTGKEFDIITAKYQYDLRSRIKESAELLGLDIKGFDIKNCNFLQSELENQVLSYIFSCSFSDIIHQQELEADTISGFSMGLYAALYHGGSIDFQTGLWLINDMYSAVKRLMNDEKYALLSVIGFSRKDLESLMPSSQNTEIVIQNGIFSFVIAGKAVQIESLRMVLENEGAVYLSQFSLSSPYHAKILLEHSNEFQAITNRYSFSNSKLPLISMIDQKTLKKEEDLRTEVVKNVSQPMNFYQTLTTMNQMGINDFVEIGADASLLKSSKFIEGDFSFKAIAKGKYL